MTEYKLSASLEEHEDDVSPLIPIMHHDPGPQDLIKSRSARLFFLVHPSSSPPQEMLLSAYGNYCPTILPNMTAQFPRMAPPSSTLSPTFRLHQSILTAW